MAAASRDERSADLRALFTHVKQTEQDPLQVIGASWLYNLGAYRRLFPPAYIATAHPMPRRFQRMPLWGQFLKRDGRINDELATEFRERLGRASDLDGLADCFPYQVLSVKAPVREFYDFFEIR